METSTKSVRSNSWWVKKTTHTHVAQTLQTAKAGLGARAQAQVRVHTHSAGVALFSLADPGPGEALDSGFRS